VLYIWLAFSIANTNGERAMAMKNIFSAM